MNFCKQSVNKRIYTVGHTVMHCSFHKIVFSLFGGEVARVEGYVQGERETSTIGVPDVKFTKNQYRV